LALVDALTLPTDHATGSALRLAPHPGIRALWQTATAKAVAKGGWVRAHALRHPCPRMSLLFYSFLLVHHLPTTVSRTHAGIEDEEAAAEQGDDDAMDVGAGAEAEAEGPSNNPLGRERVRAWGQALRAAQEAAEDRDGAREEDEGLPAPVAVPFLSIKTGQAAVEGEGEGALPKEMWRDPELWGRAKVRGVMYGACGGASTNTTPTQQTFGRSLALVSLLTDQSRMLCPPHFNDTTTQQGALKRFAKEFPLETQEHKQKKQVRACLVPGARCLAAACSVTCHAFGIHLLTAAPPLTHVNRSRHGRTWAGASGARRPRPRRRCPRAQRQRRRPTVRQGQGQRTRRRRRGCRP
jgi:hypothetical protein